MSESQPDMLGGKAVPGSRLRRIRRTGKPPIAKDGWADKPGTGPEGETCGSCTYCEAFHYAKRYYKCAARLGRHWQGGRATDIRPLDPACSKWAPNVNRANQKATAHEADRLPVPVSQPDAASERRDAGQGQPVRGNNTSRGGAALEDGASKPAARRPQCWSAPVKKEEELQRVFEF